MFFSVPNLCALNAGLSLVYEYAPGNTVVDYGIFPIGIIGTDYTLTIDATLNQLFYLDQQQLKVRSGVNVTRFDTNSGNTIKGNISCIIAATSDTKASYFPLINIS